MRVITRRPRDGNRFHKEGTREAGRFPYEHDAPIAAGDYKCALLPADQEIPVNGIFGAVTRRPRDENKCLNIFLVSHKQKPVYGIFYSPRNPRAPGFFYVTPSHFPKNSIDIIVSK